MNLSSYRTLGHSGLIVSPLALGTMTFGTGRWGVDETGARAIFDAYIDNGGNFIDTADVYAGGNSEAMLGRFIHSSGSREKIVISTKAGFPRRQDTPLSSGNSARNIRNGIDGSLKRLGTDYIDLFWTHVWDQTTPPEEVLRALTDAVRRGDILYYGFSNAPSWYVAQIATLARANGLPEPVGLQYAYSLIDRGIELDILPAGKALGMGLVAWSPLGAGLLTGKYGREKLAHAGPSGSLPNTAGDPGQNSNGRLNGDNPFGGMLFTEANFHIVDTLREVSDALGRPMAQVALAWVVQRAGVSSVLIGASSAAQMAENLASLDITLPASSLDTLDAAGALPVLNPYYITRLPKERIFSGYSIADWS
ncbi:aldo/keto reductase [Shimwellia pseudoproteus]|uniref:aldo/keto reductase n=1 Tax=Shimwellia pseudoproteus TaxID=570012 RepID=UPI0018EDD1F1|nr:aldo/keto reductase [Shimwellia pseudoproteus]MBJ3816507.1 aldo/keto reductase [Shimwellia pseudoproteus]